MQVFGGLSLPTSVPYWYSIDFSSFGFACADTNANVWSDTFVSSTMQSSMRDRTNHRIVSTLVLAAFPSSLHAPYVTVPAGLMAWRLSPDLFASPGMADARENQFLCLWVSVGMTQ